MLRVTGLRKSYGDIQALDGVDLVVERGEIVGLVGPNGAGKTSLISIVAGLRRSDAGTVTIDGVDVQVNHRATQRNIGLAPQDLGVYPSLIVRDNLVVFGELASLRRNDLRRRIEETAELMRITEFLYRPVRTLSGGEKRRVHTAMALLHRPALLLLDEPTAGVDVHTRADLLDAVRSLAADGASVCYSTHYLGEIEALGASVALIERGRIIARGAVRDLVDANAIGAVELTFDGEPPALVTSARSEVEGTTMRVYSREPAAEAASLLAALGSDAGSLRSVEIVRPSLETVFLSLTGRRYSADVEEPPRTTQ